MGLSPEYETELAKLTEIFANVDDGKRKLTEGLIQDAAFLYAENLQLKASIGNTGMVRMHPTIASLQKPTEAAKQYLKNINSYAVVIKTLNSVLSKFAPEDEDEFEKWITSRKAVADIE